MQTVIQLPTLISALFVNDVNNDVDVPLPSNVLPEHPIRPIASSLECSLNKIYSQLKKPELIKLYYMNVFDGFVPNWHALKSYQIDNVFNTYTKISKIYKTMQNRNKIKESNKSKFFLNFRLYKPC
jgi:hypothetical protein